MGLENSEILGITGIDQPTHPYVIEHCAGTLKKLIQLPRNSFKSSVMQAFICWLLWHNQDLRIMIDSETLGNAKLYLAGVKDLIQNSETMRQVCVDEEGNYVLEPNYSLAGGCVEDQIILLHRRKVGLKEPSVFCSGVDNARTGMHPDVIIMDDLVSERNVTTENQLQKVEDHYKYSLSLLEIGGGCLFVIGTRYHMADLYGKLIEGKTLDTLVRPAISAEGDLYFPARLTDDFLKQMKKEQGSYIYSCQYMLDPVNPEDAIFKREFIQYIDEMEIRGNVCERYITVDPAVSQSERSDYTVIMVTGVDPEKKRYVERVIRKRMLPNELINTLFEVVGETKHIKKVGIEAVAFQKALIYFVKNEMRRRNHYFNLIELKADKDKIRRAQMIQPAWENGDYYLNRNECKELVRELMEFPMSEHDDTVDAMAYVEQLLKPVNSKKQVNPYTWTAVDTKTGY